MSLKDRPNPLCCPQKLPAARAPQEEPKETIGGGLDVEGEVLMAFLVEEREIQADNLKSTLGNASRHSEANTHGPCSLTDSHLSIYPGSTLSRAALE